MMKSLLELSYSSTFHINECDFFINFLSLIQKYYDKPVSWHDLCYITNDTYDGVKFTSNDENLAKFINYKWCEDNSSHIVSEMFDIDIDRFTIEMSEIFMEEYDNLFFVIKVYEKNS